MVRLLNFLAAACLVILAACETNLPEAQKTFPDLTIHDYQVGSNDALSALGRILFYDKQLSINNSVSCASCHKQALAFTDDARFSRGFENQLTSRNSMPIQNLQSTFISDSLIIIDPFPGVFPQALFWDGRELNINTLSLQPISNHVEMGITDFGMLEKKLSAVPYYPQLFKQAFGDDNITANRVAEAIAWFMRNIQSTDSKFDLAKRGSATLTAFENRGEVLFIEQYDCNSCHQIQNPNGYIAAGTFSNIGLDVVYKDNGFGLVSKNSKDNGRFKIPSLRNVALTAPFMHDGRFATLSDVIDHYSSGIADHPSLDARLRDSNGAPVRMDISSDEKQAIIAFLNTLTDYTMVTDPKLSDPFKSK